MHLRTSEIKTEYYFFKDLEHIVFIAFSVVKTMCFLGRISDDLLLNPKTNTNGANNLTEWRNFDGTRHSEKLNQITLADMELIPNTAYVYFEFSGTSNVGGNELKVIRNVHVPLK